MKFLRTVAITVATAILCALPASAQSSYPAEPITLVVGTKAGGGADTFARIVAQFAEKHLGATMVVVNKPGGGGLVALNEFVDGNPDGYTLFTALLPHIIYWAELRPKGQSGFELGDLVHIATPVRLASAFHVRKDSRFKTLDDLIAYAKDNPGKVTIGMNGARSGGHGLIKRFEQAAGVDVTEVNYSSGADQVRAVLAGEIDVLNTNVMHAVKHPDDLRSLAFAGAKRSKLRDDVPTFEEQGVKIEDYVTRGIVAVPGTPAPIVRHLREGFASMAKDPEFKVALRKAGLPLDYMNAAEVEAYIASFIADNQAVFDEFRQ